MVRYLSLAAVLVITSALSAFAQGPVRGEIQVPGVATGEELIQQRDLWVLEVNFKPLRMVTVELTDPATGQKRLERVMYLVYRAVNRPLAARGVDKERQPANEFDPPVSPPMFVPEFTLVAEDDGQQRIYHDIVIPEAQAAINRRERRNYKNSVEVVGPIPDFAQPGEPAENAIYGVAMFRGVDPAVDRFTLYLTGFSNGFRRVEGPDGKPIIQTKTLVQKYWRPGDQFDTREREIRLDGDSRWIYR